MIKRRPGLLGSVISALALMPACGGGSSPPPPSNPVPAISSLSPSSVLVSSADFDLTINGSGFLVASTVSWNGAARATTLLNGGQLQVHIAASDLQNAAVVQVTVQNPTPGGGTSNVSAFTIANPAPAITGLTPDSVEVRSNGSITISGSGFVPSSSVELNGVARVPTFVNATTLRFDFSAVEITVEDTSLGVVVRNAAPGGGFSVASSLRVRPAPGAFLQVDDDNNGAPGAGISSTPRFSADGRYVAFLSSSALVPDVPAGVVSVYLRDTCLGAASCTPSTRRISLVDSPDPQLPVNADHVAISADGRFIAFTTHSGPNTSAGVVTLFLADACTGAAGCVPSLRQLDTRTFIFAPTATGVALSANAKVAVWGYVGKFSAVAIAPFVRPLCGSDPNCSSDPSFATLPLPIDDSFQLSSDGRYLNLGATIALGGHNDEVRDLCVGASAGCVIGSVNVQGFPSDPRVSMGPSPRFFQGNLPDGNGNTNAFRYDTCFGAAAGCQPGQTQVNVTSAGQPVAGTSNAGGMSADGRFVVFGTNSPDLPGGGGPFQLYVRDSCLGASHCVPATLFVTQATGGPSAGQRAPFDCAEPSITPDGKFVVFAGNGNIYLARTGF